MGGDQFPNSLSVKQLYPILLIAHFQLNSTHFQLPSVCVCVCRALITTGLQRARICHDALFPEPVSQERDSERERESGSSQVRGTRSAGVRSGRGRWQKAGCVNALCIRVCARLTAPLPPSALTGPPLIKDDTSECPDTHTHKFTNQKVYFLEAVSQEKSGWEKLE